MNEERLATELLHELKAANKRWFYAFVIVLVLWFATIAGFLWYAGLPSEEIAIENESGNANYIGNDMNGDFNYGQDNSQEETSQD